MPKIICQGWQKPLRMEGVFSVDAETSGDILGIFAVFSFFSSNLDSQNLSYSLVTKWLGHCRDLLITRMKGIHFCLPVDCFVPPVISARVQNRPHLLFPTHPLGWGGVSLGGWVPVWIAWASPVGVTSWHTTCLALFSALQVYRPLHLRLFSFITSKWVTG